MIPNNWISLNPFNFLAFLTYVTATDPYDNVKQNLTFALEMKEYKLLFSLHKYDLWNFLNNCSYACNDIFQQCTFDFASFNCCNNIFTTLGVYGNCHTLNIPAKTIGKPVVQAQVGKMFGLEVILTHNQTDLPRYSPNYVYAEEGFIVSLGSPITLWDSFELTVAPNMVVQMTIALQRYVYDPQIADCTNDPYPLAYKQDITANSITLCQQECQINASLDSTYCGCTPILSNTKVPNSKICTPPQLLQCYFQRQIQLNYTYRQLMQDCQAKNCPKQCNSVSYVPLTVFNVIT